MVPFSVHLHCRRLAVHGRRGLLRESGAFGADEGFVPVGVAEQTGAARENVEAGRQVVGMAAVESEPPEPIGFVGV